MSDYMTVNLTELEQAQINYRTTYYLAGCCSTFGGQDLRIDWQTFCDAVNEFIMCNELEASSVALRFVYCFDEVSGCLYFRLQILTMVQVPNDPNTYQLVPEPCSWYVLDSNGMNPTTDTGLSDEAYLNYLYYCGAEACTAATVQNLAAAAYLYPQNVTFPWLAEIYQMYLDNNCPENGCIGLLTCAFPSSQTTPVDYPQTLALYLADDCGTMLVNDTETTGFEFKAADSGTLCPSSCNVYIPPVMGHKPKPKHKHKQ